MTFTTDSKEVSRVIPSPNFHTSSNRRRNLIVVHSAETPLTQGYADSVAKNWFGQSASQVSSHYFAAPSYNLQMVQESKVAWHVGSPGNRITIGIEQPGRASFSRQTWLKPKGREQIENLAELMSDISNRNGGMRNPLRASRNQIRSYSAGGALPGGVRWCSHHQITTSIGGTTHTDPDPNFPYDLLRELLEKMRPSTSNSPKGTYVVRKGDTLWAIARDEGTTVPELVAANSLDDPGLIHAGQELKLSTGKSAPSKPKPSTSYLSPPGSWPLPSGHFFGSITGPNKSHGGYYKSERKFVRWIQLGMVELGYARTNAGKPTRAKAWADGKYGQATVSAVARWQKAKHASTTSLPGEFWSDDFANLKNDWSKA